MTKKQLTVGMLGFVVTIMASSARAAPFIAGGITYSVDLISTNLGDGTQS
jgi:hypothetical protein